MISLKEIRQRPTVVDKKHESLFRAYHVVRVAREMLEEGTPPKVVLYFIEACYTDDLSARHEATWEELRDD